MTSNTVKKEVNEKQLEKIREAFDKFDLEGNGVIELKELKNAMKDLGFEPSKEEMKRIISDIDTSGSGFVQYGQFLHIMMKKMEDQTTDEEIKKAFSLFDNDKAGYITFENLKTLNAELGENLNDDEIMAMIRVACPNGENKVSFEDFIHVMKKTSLF